MNVTDRLLNVVKKQSRRLIGLMSGMSMDGVDLACVDIDGSFPDLRINLIGSHFRPYAADVIGRMQSARFGTTQDVSELNVLVASEFAACVESFLHSSRIDRDSIDAIGSHGQTLFHSMDTAIPSTLQVGSPSVISELTGIITIGNFRVRDVAAGGQGAPLVSLADYLLFRDPEGPVALNNLGSISNVTVVTQSLDGIIAFDTGPANMAIDYFVRATGSSPDGIDRDGKISEHGRCIDGLLSSLIAAPFFDREPPKAAGYAEFGPPMLAAKSAPFMASPAADLVRTGVDFAAVTLANAYRKFVLPRYPTLRKIILSGGGSHNPTLVSEIKRQLPGISVEIASAEIADFKEAMAFAILANETLSGRPGSLPQVTGAGRASVLGEISL